MLGFDSIVAFGLDGQGLPRKLWLQVTVCVRFERIVSLGLEQDSNRKYLLASVQARGRLVAFVSV
jgi:hypothetical protein